jgi:hypothetical protein
MHGYGTGMKRISIAVCTAILAAAAPTAAGHDQGENTFEGICQFSGSVRFSPPLTTAQQSGSGFAKASGTCTGTFSDARGRLHRLYGDVMRYVASNQGTTSCGLAIAEGSGYLRYRSWKLRFRLTETRVTGGAHLRLDGAGGGFAEGDARLDEREDPDEIAENCMASGLREARVDIDIVSLPPGISG